MERYTMFMSKRLSIDDISPQIDLSQFNITTRFLFASFFQKLKREKQTTYKWIRISLSYLQHWILEYSGVKL